MINTIFILNKKKLKYRKLTELSKVTEAVSRKIGI